jgi:hypothetical protein
MAAPVKRSAVVVDMMDFLEAKVRADLEQRARDRGDEFDQMRARQGLIGLARLRRKLRMEPPADSLRCPGPKR